jgi:glycerol-3-phosphate dehydrogenase
MLRDLPRLASMRYDLLVVGGGIYGLTAAYDAAQRGLSVGLIERADFGSGTSFNHLKTMHGGLRYLQSIDLGRMRESVRERRTIARIAPHLVAPLPFIMPTYGMLTRSRAAFRAAFLVDRVIARDRNDGLRSALRLPAGRVVSREECLRLFPDARADGVTGGAVWYDYQAHHADRLTLSFALAASEAGATLANYVEALALLRRNDRIVGVRARDAIAGRTFDIQAALTLTALGPWTSPLLATGGVRRERPLLKAMNVVTRRPMGEVAWAATTAGGRALIAAPWQGRALIGTSESDRPCEPGEVRVTEMELSAFLAEIGQAFPGLRITADEVTLVHRGIVPATARSDGRVALSGRPAITDHAADGVEGLLSLVGVKYTTARAVAARAIDRAAQKLDRGSAACRTATTPLPGGDVDDPEALCAELVKRAGGRVSEESARHLGTSYGTRARGILDEALRHSGLVEPVAPSHPVLRAEILHAVRAEMACTLADVVIRRTGLGSAEHPGREVVERCATLLGAELGWTPERMREEIEAVDRFYEL